MPRPYYPVLLDHQLLANSLCSIKQPHVDKFNVATCASLPVDDIIIGYGVTLKIKVYLLSINVKCHFLEVVLELESQQIRNTIKFIKQSVQCDTAALKTHTVPARGVCCSFERMCYFGKAHCLIDREGGCAGNEQSHIQPYIHYRLL